MANILEYREPKFAGMIHGYHIYCDSYAQMCDEPLAEFWNADKAKAKKLIKRAWRQHTPRICKKRLARNRCSFLDSSKRGGVR